MPKVFALFIVLRGLPTDRPGAEREADHDHDRDHLFVSFDAFRKGTLLTGEGTKAVGRSTAMLSKHLRGKLFMSGHGWISSGFLEYVQDPWSFWTCMRTR